MIERYHGTYRARDKVMHGMDNIESAAKMMEYWRTYYNFILEHISLGGITPANAIGIGIGTSQHRWMNLLEKSL